MRLGLWHLRVIGEGDEVVPHRANGTRCALQQIEYVNIGLRLLANAEQIGILLSSLLLRIKIPPGSN